MITTINPCNFDDVPHNDPNRVFAFAGMIPMWVLGWDDQTHSLKEWINKVYAHGGGWSHSENWVSGFTWNPTNLSLHYPGDSPMHPFLKLEQNEVEFYIMESAIVVITDKQSQVISIQRWD